VLGTTRYTLSPYYPVHCHPLSLSQPCALQRNIAFSCRPYCTSLSLSSTELSLSLSLHQVGICVDVHVDRIAVRLGWAPLTPPGRKNRTPEDTRKTLEGWLPAHHWVRV
jgi:hypothetical protein